MRESFGLPAPFPTYVSAFYFYCLQCSLTNPDVIFAGLGAAQSLLQKEQCQALKAHADPPYINLELPYSKSLELNYHLCI